MKLTKLGQLRSFVAYPRCWADNGVDEGVLLDDDPAEERESAPAFAKDTPFDKVLRFGCGAILGGLIVVGVLMFGLLQPFGTTGLIIGSVIAVGASGLVSVTHGEDAIRVLLKLIKWLA